MGTWIDHLRIAENVLAKIQGVDELAFIYGSLAPDSGMPNENWSQFDPPKTVTHFLAKGEGESGARDIHFYKQYLFNQDLTGDKSRYSFLLAYFLHLVCDRLAGIRIGQPTLLYNAALFSARSGSDAWGKIKRDWYDLDHRFLRDYPAFSAWNTFLESDVPPCPVPYLTQKSFDHQMNYIKSYYSHPGDTRVLDRKYPFLNESTKSRFVLQTTSNILEIMSAVVDGSIGHCVESATELLSPVDRMAYPNPLGDL